MKTQRSCEISLCAALSLCAFVVKSIMKLKQSELTKRKVIPSHSLLICFILTLLSFFNVPYVIAQQDSTTSSSNVFVQDTRSALNDAGTIITAPLHFSDEDWIKTAAVIGGTALCFTVDGSVRTFMLRQQSATGDNLANIGHQYGSGLNAVLFSGGLYAGGLIAGNESVRKTGVMTFESVALAGGTTVVLKMILGRSRPYTEEGTVKFRGFQTDDAHLSMPSGHTTVAFALSSVLAGRIRNTAASIVLYSLAALTATSRMYDDEHWLSDTFLGAAIGTTVGLSVLHLHSEESKESSLRLVPKAQGVGIAYVF